MAIADKLRRLRLDRGESRQEVARRVGVSRSHLWELENGTSTNPGLELLRSFAEHFNVPVAYLADDATPEEVSASLHFFRGFEGQLTENDWAMLRAVAKRLEAGPASQLEAREVCGED
ncbi:MAG TPA: helix-turn-helix transcriptional regulator [Caulobacteraceae bacterium]